MSQRTIESYQFVLTPEGWRAVDAQTTPNGADITTNTWARVVGLISPMDGLRQEASVNYAGASITFDASANVLDPRGLVTISASYAANAAGTALVPGRMVDETAASIAPAANASLRGASFKYTYDGTNFVRSLGASVATLATLSPTGAQLIAHPGEWSINLTPAANTQATVTRALSASQRHVCRSITATLIGLAASAEATVLVNLRDGATGAGTILWSARLLVVGGSGSETGITLTDLNIIGSAGTAMTLEFAAAGGANTFETVSLSGYTTT